MIPHLRRLRIAKVITDAAGSGTLLPAEAAARMACTLP